MLGRIGRSTRYAEKATRCGDEEAYIRILIDQYKALSFFFERHPQYVSEFTDR